MLLNLSGWFLNSCDRGVCSALTWGELKVNWADPASFTLIVKGTEFSSYWNDMPIGYFNNLEQRSGNEVKLSFDSGSWIEYDNLKIWDLDEIPNLP